MTGSVTSRSEPRALQGGASHTTIQWDKNGRGKFFGVGYVKREQALANDLFVVIQTRNPIREKMRFGPFRVNADTTIEDLDF